ncbi:hypothetical protein ACFWII_23820 [Streptomyces sp. NPDC127063]|uniref:hypothetical protein n=1 Tax=Streptomyces sp. NPDC127063 TaxID=3347123 RepID=UPI00365FEA84
MVVEQLPGAVREFAQYLDALLARLDAGDGWCGVFWQRDPDGMRACREGRELPPWDVLEALLQDFAGRYGPGAAAAQTERARALHAAAVTAYDARPGGRDALADRLDVMLREQRYAAERCAALTRALAAATTREEADALRHDLAWSHDDHTRARSRCAELRARLHRLTPAAGVTPVSTGHAATAAAGPATAAAGGPAAVAAAGGHAAVAAAAGSAAVAAAAGSAAVAAGAPAGAPPAAAAAAGIGAAPAAGPAAPVPAPGAAAPPSLAHLGGGRPTPGALATERPAPAPAATEPAAPGVPAVERSAPVGGRKRKLRRGSARFAGAVDDGDATLPVPPVAGPAPVAGRTPRGARFAGAVQEADVPAPVEPVDEAARRQVADAVGRLARLRADGRTGEAHALLAEAAHWPAARFPLLAAELHRAGLGADWTTLLWEAASLPAAGLVAAADALVAAGRDADGEQILRQGVVRPADEIGAAVRDLYADGRHREAHALLGAYVRVRPPEEAARSAAADPALLAPLLLHAARTVSDEHHWDVLHALRVAGHTT